MYRLKIDWSNKNYNIDWKWLGLSKQWELPYMRIKRLCLGLIGLPGIPWKILEKKEYNKKTCSNCNEAPKKIN